MTGKRPAMTIKKGRHDVPFVTLTRNPFASCHSERSEESHSAQDRLREGEGARNDRAATMLTVLTPPLLLG